jgi:hypothetical protein
MKCTKIGYSKVAVEEPTFDTTDRFVILWSYFTTLLGTDVLEVLSD